ncbi:hypothetical protein J7K99_04055, partial [bacterium]|nr:hypothetical protein [bacterium]
MPRKILSILWTLSSMIMAAPYVSTIPGDGELMIKFSTPPLAKHTIHTQYGDFVKLFSDDAQTIMGAGAPELPSFVIPVGIPPDGEVSVEYDVFWGAPQRIDFPIAPVDSVWWDGGEIRRMSVPPRDQLYRAEFPAVKFVDRGFLRSQRIGQVVITPVIYDPSAKTITVADSVVVRLRFGKVSGEQVPEGKFETVLKRALANYEQAKNFRRTTTDFEIPENVFARADVWYRVAVREGGVFAITADWFREAGLDPTEISPDSVRVFTYGVGTLPLDAGQPLPTLGEIPLLFVGDDDGAFEDGETLFVYAPGPEWWTAESRLGQWHDSPYCDSVSYWIAIGGEFDSAAKRLFPLEFSDPIAEFHYGWTFTHIGENLQFDEYEGNGWYWQLVYGEAGVYFSDPRITQEVSPNGGITVRPSSRLDILECNGAEYSYISSPQWVENLQPGSNSVIAHYSPGSNNDSTVYFKWVEINYAINLQPHDGVLHFYTRESDATGNVKYVLSDFDEVPMALDVSDIFAIRQLAVHQDGEQTYFVDQPGAREYFVFVRAATRTFPEPVEERNFDLWNFAENNPGTDYIILAPQMFNTSSLESYLRDRGFSPVTVTVEEIMRQFGFGRYDPTAVRNFLCYVYNTFPAPKPVYAVFVGDGHYDFRHRLTDAAIYFPPAMAADRQTDAFYATFSDGSEFMEMLTGRIPVRSQEELEQFVQKMSDYSTCAPFGVWRITAVPVGDDEYRTDGGHDNLTYTVNASELVESVFPARIISDPIYLIEYPRTPSGKKPLARQALIDRFNTGAVLINYIGHGNYHLWAHEHIMNMPGDLSSYENGKKLPLVTAFSCYVSQFYYLNGKECISELLMRKYPGGAIATIAATGGSFAGSNQALNRRLVEYLFGDEPISIAGALVAARAGLYTSINNHDSQYILMGDPSQVLAFPYPGVEVSLSPETLAAGQWDTVSGTAEIAFDGVAKIFLFAPDRTKFYDSPLSGVGSCNYTVPGKVLFAGAASVDDGEFSLPIFVPKNLSETQGYKV